MKEKKEKLVTVARFDDYMKADLARQLLEDEGIKAFVMGQNVGNVGSGVPAVVDIELQTPASEAEEAREILEANKPQAGEGEFEEDEDVEEDEDLDEDEPDFEEGPQDVQE